MSHSIQPDEPRPHSITSAAVASRLAGVHGRGRGQVPLVWFAILAHTPWDGAERPTWASNQTLSNETGLTVVDVEFAINRLRVSGMLSTPEGRRPGAMRLHGRLLVPDIDTPARVLMPSKADVKTLWSLAFGVSKQPVALVTLMVGMFVLASDERGTRPDRMWRRVPGTVANLRRFVGARHGSTFTGRLAALESLGLISRKHGLEIAPPSRWGTATPAPVKVPEYQSPEGDALPYDHDPQWDLDPDWGTREDY